MVLTGLILLTGDELATAASSVLGQELMFEHTSEDDTRKVVKAHSDSDESEIQ
ncbi:uncharacterized protein DSM5745_10607 [Aspergillus mulundensis]|uniref:Uncharacterized protein n=1 Tax=Aspergillus mulundensis TaxID=1810919 RepID=A0A3D8QH55_9EURO|nr:hypothetical protein DSM5745_10607 [Aspergillus mulundensis]RDW61109.1 hypothetical protein DSM5745_10607 [Aspergillus mulundensis]